MCDSSESRNLKLYKISYYMNCTALVMPVLPLWWTNDMGISTEAYLSTLACVSLAALILDIPMSLLADKIGNKVTLSSGLAVFTLSFVLAASGDGQSSFYAYAVSNTLAEGLLSGSSVALLRQIAGDKEYRKELFALSRQYYMFTSVLFFVGVALYLISPRLLLWLQAFMLAAACVCVLGISPDGGRGSERTDRQKSNEIVLSDYINEGFIRYVVGVLAVCLLFGYFNGLMQFQNRTIQLLTSGLNIGALNPLWLSAAFLFLGNVLTSLGVGKRIEQSMRSMSQASITCVLLCVAAVASVLLSVDSVAAAFVGYCAICMLKGAYRSEYNELAVRVQPSRRHSASWISVINTAACLVASGLNLLVSVFSGSGVAAIQLVWAFTALACGVVAIPAFLIARSARLPLAGKGMSSKKSSVLFNFNSHEAPVFIQDYPSATYRDRTLRNYGYVTASGLSCASVVTTLTNEFKSSIVYERLDCPNLEEAKDRTFENLERIDLIADLMNRPVSGRDGAVPEMPCPGGHLLEMASKVCTCKTFCHGDLNPGNVMVDEGCYWLVDWDLAGVGPRVYDEFSLVFHPGIDAKVDVRLREMGDLISRHGQGCPLHQAGLVYVVNELLAAKLEDCKSWPVNETTSRLMSGYHNLMGELQERARHDC